MIILATSAFIDAYIKSDVFGKLIFITLLFMSIISWIILAHKIWIHKKIKKLSGAFEKMIDNKRDSLLLLNTDTNFSHPFLSIFNNLKTKTLEILGKNKHFIENQNEHTYISSSDIELIESYISAEIATQTKWIDKNLFILSTTVTLGPFFGLLGTVWGILITFAGLQSHASISSNEAVLGGLSLALTTTVIGLIVAIPALVAYNYLKTVSKDFTIDMENFAAKLLATIELQYRKVDK